MNKEEFDFLGITKFHEAGFLGQGITVVSIENGKTKHSKKVENILRQILPKANIISNIKYWKDVPGKLDGYTCSQDRADSNDPDKMAKAKELYAKNIFMTCAIGNEDTESYNALAKHNEWISVGACDLKNGKPKFEYYSSKSEYLDFVSLTNLKTDEGRFTGSSCATPVLQAMAMLVQQFFREKTGKKLTNAELFKFMKDNCMDLGDRGKDNSYGYGLFILPEPNSINIYKYGDVRRFKDNTEYEKAIDFLAREKEMDSPNYWKERIKKNNDTNLMWFCTKWANAVSKN